MKQSLKIALTGSGGFIGNNFKTRLYFYEIITIPRSLLYGTTESLSDFIKNCDIVVNMAGAPILQRWNKKNKKMIYESRVNCTKNLVKAINYLEKKDQPQTFISVSAIGIYECGKTHTEKSKDFDNGFLGKVVKDWEAASLNLNSEIRRVIFRLGLVLGPEAVLFKKLLPLFKLGLGGKLASGRQAFPFIDIDDLISCFEKAITDKNYSGIYNLVTPQEPTNKDFTNALATRLKRPAIWTVPGFALKIIYGKAATLLLQNPSVVPKRLIEQNYYFKYPDIEQSIYKNTGYKKGE